MGKVDYAKAPEHSRQNFLVIPGTEVVLGGALR